MRFDEEDQEHGVGKAGEVVAVPLHFDDGIYVDVSYASPTSIGMLTGVQEGQVNHLSDALFEFGLEHSTANQAPCPAQIEAARTPKGGWNATTLAGWGIPWPPPGGWKKKLEEASGCACSTITACQRDIAA